jgi:predicted alpha/beta superfamily hydrolase
MYAYIGKEASCKCPDNIKTKKTYPLIFLLDGQILMIFDDCSKQLLFNKKIIIHGSHSLYSVFTWVTLFS